MSHDEHRSKIEAHRLALAEHRAAIDAFNAKFMALDKSLDKMTKLELRAVICRKDEELAVLRNRLARYGDQQATSTQLSAAVALVKEAIHETR
jgi:hypothetical protein